jgi:hypothetical protein
MSLKHHFKFNIFDAKTLGIAMTSSFSTWAATGFQHDLSHLSYVAVGFITGGLVSHNSMASPNVTPDSHIQTPYVSNIEDKNPGVPEPSPVVQTYKPEGADVKKVIQINSGIIK